MTTETAACAWLRKEILPKEQRVWQGEQQPGTAPQSRQARTAQGEIGERMAARALQEKEGQPFLNQNERGRRPAPLDLYGAGLGVEVKTGISSRSSGAWSVTTGAIGPKERALLSRMTPADKEEYWAAKRQMALQRKEEMLRKLSASLGQEVKGVTVGIILSPDGTKGDVFLVDGLHARLGWRKFATPENYIGTYSTMMELK